MSLRVDASIGIAIAPDHGPRPESLLQKADVAMFAAKRAHAPWQIYSSEQDQNARERLDLMEALRDAIGPARSCRTTNRSSIFREAG